MATSPTLQKPGMVTALSILTLISGIGNILWGLSLTFSIIVGTLGLGIICAPITILPVVLGIFEIIYGAKLMANPPNPIQPSKTLAILEIVAVIFFNFFSVVVGILALVFYNDQEVMAYFEEINQA
ncbi:MAG: hypothetical protein IH859_07820 [Chloroflexi bacterium]|nr:hypothetical protein [Chloroflexota bacterium]